MQHVWAHFAVYSSMYSSLTPCIVANLRLSQNFCLRDTSARGYVPDPPSLFSRTGGSGDETSSGYEWLAGLVFRVCMAGLASLQGLHEGSEYFAGPNIT